MFFQNNDEYSRNLGKKRPGPQKFWAWTARPSWNSARPPRLGPVHSNLLVGTAQPDFSTLPCTVRVSFQNNHVMLWPSQQRLQSFFSQLTISIAIEINLRFENNFTWFTKSSSLIEKKVITPSWFYNFFFVLFLQTIFFHHKLIFKNINISRTYKKT